VAPWQRGIAQQLPFPALCQTMLLWLQGLAPRRRSLPSVNPGDPPPQHTGPDHVTKQLQAQPLPSLAPAKHRVLPRTAPGPLCAGV